MKSWVRVFGKTAEATNSKAYQYIVENSGKFQINGEGKEYKADELRCVRECINRLLPKKK